MKKVILSFLLFVSFLSNAQQRVFSFQNNSIGVQLPSINTVDITNLASTSVTSGGTLVADGGSAISAKGICWSTSANPTIANSTINSGTGTSAYTASITGLLANTTYYARAYATNGLGTSYGNQITFTTLQAPAPPPFSSVVIGTQTWSSVNLNVSKYRNGDIIPQVTDPATWAGLTTGAWCWYNNDSATYAATFGKLYNWYAVNDSRGLAPSGWHIPSYGEYDQLATYLGGSNIAGGAMKQTGTSLWFSNTNTGATNSSGFSGLPGGLRFTDGTFGNTVGIYGFWWSADDSGSVDNAQYRYVKNDNTSLISWYYFKKGGLSVRCVKD